MTCRGEGIPPTHTLAPGLHLGGSASDCVGMDSTWMITGVSRGLGRELARTLLSAGATVVGTTRSGTAGFCHARLHLLALDVTDPSQPAAAVERAIELTGGLDVVVNNAGHGLLGPIEATSEAEALAVLQTNLLGAWSPPPRRICASVAPGT